MSREAKRDASAGADWYQDDCGYSQFVALMRQMRGSPASVTHPFMRLDLVIATLPQHVQRVYDTLRAVERQSEVHPMRGSNAGDAPALDMVCLEGARAEHDFIARHHLRMQLFSRAAPSACLPDMNHITNDGRLARNFHALQGGADHDHSPADAYPYALPAAAPVPHDSNIQHGDPCVGNLAAYFSIAFTLNGMPIILHPRYNGAEGDQVWLPVRDVSVARQFYRNVLDAFQRNSARQWLADSQVLPRAARASPARSDSCASCGCPTAARIKPSAGG